MRVAFALGVLCLLSACNSITTNHVLDNLESCTRHYDGAVAGGMTGGQFSGTVKVDCLPKGVASPPS